MAYDTAYPTGLSTVDPRDRARGILLGLAAGDRIGGPLRMALCLAESLAESKGFTREDILRRYLAWWGVEGFDSGPVAGRVFDLIASGVIIREAVAQAHAESGELTADWRHPWRLRGWRITARCWWERSLVRGGEQRPFPRN